MSPSFPLENVGLDQDVVILAKNERDSDVLKNMRP